jgi:hypothetical protein
MNKEKIISIKEADFTLSKEEYAKVSNAILRKYAGFQIETDKQIIKLGISNDQLCCEDWGYLMSNDDFEEFEGSSLLEISITDTALNTKKLEKQELSYPELMFVNFATDRGTLQFVAYNQHEGYYGHEVVILSNQINYCDFL